MSVQCPYCGKDALYLPDNAVYQRSYGGYVYVCIPCDAHIGCHKSGDHRKPKGSLANQELRTLRVRAHFLFDPLWRYVRNTRGWSKAKSRNAAYKWLAEEMGIPWKDCHIGMFRDEEVKLAIEICERVYAKAKLKAA